MAKADKSLKSEFYLRLKLLHYLVTSSPENSAFPFENDSFNVPVENPSPQVESAVRTQSLRLFKIWSVTSSVSDGLIYVLRLRSLVSNNNSSQVTSLPYQNSILFVFVQDEVYA